MRHTSVINASLQLAAILQSKSEFLMTFTRNAAYLRQLLNLGTFVENLVENEGMCSLDHHIHPKQKDRNGIGFMSKGIGKLQTFSSETGSVGSQKTLQHPSNVGYSKSL